MKRTLLLLLLLIPISWIVWGVTAKEEGDLAWGNLVTAKDQGAAEFIGVSSPGAYVGTRNGKALPAVRGGLKLIFTFQDWSLGFRAITSRIFLVPEGYFFFGSFVVWIGVIVGLVLVGRKKPSSKAASSIP